MLPLEISNHFDRLYLKVPSCSLTTVASGNCLSKRLIAPQTTDDAERSKERKNAETTRHLDLRAKMLLDQSVLSDVKQTRYELVKLRRIQRAGP